MTADHMPMMPGETYAAAVVRATAMAVQRPVVITARSPVTPYMPVATVFVGGTVVANATAKALCGLE